MPVERPGGDDHYREGKFRLGKDLGGIALETELLWQYIAQVACLEQGLLVLAAQPDHLRPYCRDFDLIGLG